MEKFETLFQSILTCFDHIIITADDAVNNLELYRDAFYDAVENGESPRAGDGYIYSTTLGGNLNSLKRNIDDAIKHYNALQRKIV